jgi:hypothetical protein
MVYKSNKQAHAKLSTDSHSNWVMLCGPPRSLTLSLPMAIIFLPICVFMSPVPRRHLINDAKPRGWGESLAIIALKGWYDTMIKKKPSVSSHYSKSEARLLQELCLYWDAPVSGPAYEILMHQWGGHDSVNLFTLQSPVTWSARGPFIRMKDALWREQTAGWARLRWHSALCRLTLMKHRINRKIKRVQKSVTSS